MRFHLLDAARVKALPVYPDYAAVNGNVSQANLLSVLYTV